MFEIFVAEAVIFGTKEKRDFAVLRRGDDFPGDFPRRHRSAAVRAAPAAQAADLPTST